MLTGWDRSSEHQQQVADNHSLLQADVLSDAFNVLYSGCHLSDSESALSALPVIMMDTSLLSSVTTLSAIIATSSISDPCLSDCPQQMNRQQPWMLTHVLLMMKRIQIMYRIILVVMTVTPLWLLRNLHWRKRGDSLNLQFFLPANIIGQCDHASSVADCKHT